MPSFALAMSLGWRLLTHSINRFARFVTWVSFLGLALGVTVLTVVVTVMNGFDHELKSRLLTSVPHITVNGDALAPQALTRLQLDPEVVDSGAYFQGLGAITANGRIFPITLYGRETYGRETSLATPGLEAADALANARAQLVGEAAGIVLGRPLMRAIGAMPGEPITVVTAQLQDGVVAPRVLKFILRGSFAIGAEPDYNLALVNLSRYDLAEWRSLGETGTQIQLREPMNVADFTRTHASLFGQRPVATWQRQFGELFQAVQLEKSMMFVLLLLVVAVASFNIIAGQTMLVNDKRRSIAILRTMGCTPALIRQTFLLQGVAISTTGTLLGLLLGVTAALNINALLDFGQQVTGMHLLDGSFFVEVPVKILPQDLLLIALLSCGLCLLSSWLPARRAAALDPVSALH